MPGQLDTFMEDVDHTSTSDDVMINDFIDKDKGTE